MQFFNDSNREIINSKNEIRISEEERKLINNYSVSAISNKGEDEVNKSSIEEINEKNIVFNESLIAKNGDSSYGNKSRSYRVNKSLVKDINSLETYNPDETNRFNSIIETKQIDDTDINYSLLTNSLTSASFFKMTGNEESKTLSMGSIFIEENPVNKALSYALEDQGNMLERGHLFEIKAEDGVVSTSLKSVRNTAFPGYDIATMGMAEPDGNIISVKEEGTATEILINATGMIPVFDTTIKILSDEIDTYVHETIGGNITTKTTTGTILSEAMMQEIKSTLSTTIEAIVEMKVKAGLLDLVADGVLTLKAPMTQITGGMHVMNGTVMPGKGPYNCIPTCPFTGMPHSGSIVMGT